MRSVISFAPASVANVGPFYDVMGYCLENLGDFVEARTTNEHNQCRLAGVEGPYAKLLADVPLEDNVAQFVARQIWDDYGMGNSGIDFILHKYMPVGTGLGSSGASVVATAKAIITLLGIEKDLDKKKILDYLVAGEMKTAEQFYPDNVAPSYFGGFNIISRDDLRTVPVQKFYTLVLLQSSIETREQRKKIDQYFKQFINDDIADAEKVNFVLTISRFQAREASTLIDAFKSGDLVTAGRVISQPPPEGDKKIAVANGSPVKLREHTVSSDPGNFVELVRADTIPHYREIKAALLDQKACGVGISGSGPAIFSIVDSERTAFALKDSMLGQFKKAGNPLEFKWLVSPVNPAGAIILDKPISEFVAKANRWHNFWSA